MDARTPVIVGVGQVTNRRKHFTDPMSLMEEASALANNDAGGGALSHIGSVQVLNVVSGRYGAPATALGQRLKLPDGERLTTTVGGSTPIWLLAEACNRITRGDLEGVLVVGAEALDSARRARREGVKLRSGDAKDHQDRVIGDDRAPVSDAELRARIVAPASIYPMFEQALAARDGRTPDEQRVWLGELMAPFTDVAASHPDVAWFPRTLSPADISTVSDDNRMVAEPYTKNLNSILQVDMGAAFIVLSAEAAKAARVPRDRYVFPWAAARCDDVFLTAARPDLTRAIGQEVASRSVFEAAGVGLDDVGYFDFYSCFPSAVQLGAEAVGLPLDDPRGLTVTGGLPFFGGPGNNYVTHSIATMASRLRDDPDTIGAVTGISWYMSKHGFTLLSTTQPENGWRSVDTSAKQAEIESTAIDITSEADGLGVVEAFTVEHDRDEGPARAPIYATLEDGRRTAAAPADAGFAKELSGRSIVGEKVRLSTADGGVVYELV